MKKYKYDLEDKIYNTNFKYKGILNLPNNIIFGTELEFSNALYNNVLENLTAYQKNGMFIDYRIDIDETVVEMINKFPFGGEIKTPKLNDSIKSWKEIKQICTILKKLGGLCNVNCGEHIHFDINIFKNNSQYIMNFFKLWTVFEDIIFMFSCGENDKLRNNINRYSREIGRDIFILLNSSTTKDKSIYELRDIIHKSYYRNKQNTIRFTEFNTMEIRTPAGTLNHIIIQNNILFFSKLILYSCSKNFNEELINNMFKNYDKNKRVFEKYKNLDIERATLLANLIYDEEQDKLHFLKQYLKLFNKNDEKVLIK